MKRRFVALSLPMGLSMGLIGCAGGLFPKPPAPPSRYTLDDGRGPPAAPDRLPSGPGRPVLVVAVPRASVGFDSTAMLYLRRPHELESYAQHAWAEPPAQMLAPLLVRSLQSSRPGIAVLMAPSAASASLRLETELLRLQQDFNTSPSVLRLSLRAVLLDSGSRKPLAWREFDEAVSAPSEDAEGGVAAAHEATGRLLAALSAWLAAALAAPG
jgi:cholesterol transport system auxiliary component